MNFISTLDLIPGKLYKIFYNTFSIYCKTPPIISSYKSLEECENGKNILHLIDDNSIILFLELIDGNPDILSVLKHRRF